METQPIQRERQPRHLVPVEQPSLEALATTANREHSLSEAAIASALTHAVACGKALLGARQQVERGGWRRWLDENFAGSWSAASVYIIAEYEDRLTPDMSIGRARRAIAFLPNATLSDAAVVYDDQLRQEARRLVKAGLSQQAVADALGVSGGAVRRWTNPDQRRKADRRYTVKRAAEHKALAEKRRQQEIRRAVRKAGSALAEAYSMTSRMADVLAQAEQEAKSVETRAALEDARAHYYKMSDAIVRALGVS